MEAMFLGEFVGFILWIQKQKKGGGGGGGEFFLTIPLSVSIGVKLQYGDTQLPCLRFSIYECFIVKTIF